MRVQMRKTSIHVGCWRDQGAKVDGSRHVGEAMVRVRTRTKRLSLQPMLLTVERDDARSDVHHCPSRSFLIPARFASKTLDNGAWSRCRTGALCSTSLTDYFSPGRGKAGVAPSSFSLCWGIDPPGAWLICHYTAPGVSRTGKQTAVTTAICPRTSEAPFPA